MQRKVGRKTASSPQHVAEPFSTYSGPQQRDDRAISQHGCTKHCAHWSVLLGAIDMTMLAKRPRHRGDWRDAQVDTEITPAGDDVAGKGHRMETRERGRARRPKIPRPSARADRRRPRVAHWLPVPD